MGCRERQTLAPGPEPWAAGQCEARLAQLGTEEDIASKGGCLQPEAWLQGCEGPPQSCSGDREPDTEALRDKTHAALSPL